MSADPSKEVVYYWPGLSKDSTSIRTLVIEPTFTQFTRYWRLALRLRKQVLPPSDASTQPVPDTWYVPARGGRIILPRTDQFRQLDEFVEWIRVELHPRDHHAYKCVSFSSPHESLMWDDATGVAKFHILECRPSLCYEFRTGPRSESLERAKSFGGSMYRLETTTVFHDIPHYDVNTVGFTEADWDDAESDGDDDDDKDGEE